MSRSFSLALAFVCSLWLLADAPARGAKPLEWKEIDRLADEQKYEAAAQAAEARLAAAKTAKDEPEWTRALVRTVQLRIGLHGFETAVRFLKSEPWPRGTLHRAALNLFYAAALESYARAYSWEIQKREKVESKDALDLKAWTSEQIHAEAQRAFEEVWRSREALGSEPVGKLANHLEPGNYPKGVRDSLRDAVSYLRVSALEDTASWRPEQSNELYRLDVAALVKGDPARSAAIPLVDPSVHPLVRAAAVLDDLEAWHAGRNEREAALEARLTRLTMLQQHLSEADDRAAILQDLQSRLPQFRALPWYSVGAATLAGFWRDAGDLVRARAVADEGRAAYPDEIGGKRCLSLVKGIEAPDFQIASMSSDGPRRRSIEVTHKNLAKLYFRSYAVDLSAWIAQSRDYNLLPAGNEITALVRTAKPERAWAEELPATPDYKPHRTFVTPPLTRPGLHVVVASARQDFAEKGNRLLAVNLVVSGLVMVARDDPSGSVEVSVVSGETGRAVPGAEVLLYRADYNRAHEIAERQKTDARGVAAFAFDERKRNHSHFLVARHGGEVTINTQAFGFYRQAEPKAASAALVFTDRSIYRPMQKLFWKVISYRGEAKTALYQTQPNAEVIVSLVDANHQVVETRKVKTNEFGSAAGEFTLPTGRLLGAWRVTTSPSGSASVRVEEYKRPTFEVRFKDPDAPMRLNKPATLAGEARYYFGLPLSSGAVKWRVARTPQYPSWWEWSWYGGRGVTSQVVATGSSELKDDGTFRLTFVPEADERGSNQDVTYRYEVTADVTDEGGETRSASRAVRLGLVSVEARLTLGVGFLRQGAPGQVQLVRSSLDGVSRPGAGKWRVVSLAAPAAAVLPADEPIAAPPVQAEAGPKVATPGDSLRPRWHTGFVPGATMRRWADGSEVASGSVQHDAKGEAKAPLPALKAGAYRLRYETTDDFGARYQSALEFIVAAPAMSLPLPAVLLTEDSSLSVGDTARFLVHSGLADQPMVFDVYRAGRRIERRFLSSGKDPAIIELPVTAADRGGYSVSLTAVRDFQLLHSQASVFVPWDDKELKVEFSSFRDRIRPGAKETFTVTVKGPAGQKPEAAAAELLAYMYDQSLDSFVPHAPASVARLYPHRTGGASTRPSLGQAWAQWITSSDFAPVPPYPGLAGARLKFDGGYGIGGLGLRGFGPGGGGRGRMMQKAMRGDFAGDDQPEADAAPLARSESKRDESTFSREKVPASPAPVPAEPPGPEQSAQQQVEIRSNFSETAFWSPQLLIGPDGSASVEFTVPDSVTSWNVWVHALTRDLRGGSASKQTKSVKDLMVRPYLPRFLREGDQAAVKVVLNNASAAKLQGNLRFEIFDPDTQENLLAAFGSQAAGPQPFSAEAGQSATLTFPIVAPKRVGTVAFKVTAIAGGLSDGELRPLPVLPSRLHLAQSRFVTLRDADKRSLTFPDLAQGGDPTRIHEQLVVTVDAQLFYTVLQALPYLVNYPYECTEQTLNRFVSTGIVSSIYQQYPAVARMAQQMSKRDTPLESFDAADPNRKMTLEESPWVLEAQGGKDPGQSLVNVLDPKIAAADRIASLNKLKKAQTSLGGFPWWPGGPPSPYMTLYLAHGMAKAAEFKVAVPKDMVQRSWQYLARHYREEYAGRMVKQNCCWEFLTFLNYVASSYPDASWTGDALTMEERKQILDFSFKHWRQHSPYLKGYLALTLQRMGRAADAKKVFDSVMDSSKTTQDEGTFWAPEDRSWLWYNDTIESHAFGLRTLMELSPKDPRRAGLVQWLLLNKKLNQWKSTRATAEVLYAMVKYLEAEKSLGVHEESLVTIGPRQTKLVFEPDYYTGKKNQIVVPGPEVDPKTMATISVEKSTKGFQFASATWHFSTEQLPAESRGDLFSVSRMYFKRERVGREATLKPLAEGAKLEPGDQIEVQVSLRARHPAEYVHLRDPRAAGLEPESALSRYKWDLGIGWYEEVRDSGTNFFFEALPAGEYTFKYRLRANMGGTFRVGPATVQSMYAPEFTAYSAGHVLTVATGGR